MRRSYNHADLLVARGLGILSIGLGVFDFLKRKRVAQLIGIDNPPLIGLTGAREIATGVGLILAQDPGPWALARVGGDAFDLGSFASGIERDNPRRQGALVGLLMVIGIASVDVAIAARLHASAARAASNGL